MKNRIGISLALIERIAFLIIFMLVFYKIFENGADSKNIFLVFLPGLLVFIGVCKNVIYKPIVAFKKEKLYLRFYLSDVEKIGFKINDIRNKVIVTLLCFFSISSLSYQIFKNVENSQQINALVLMLECLIVLFSYKIISNTLKTW